MNSIKKKFDKLKLNTKFTLSILVLVAVLLTFFVLIIFRYTKNSMLQQAANDLEESVSEDYASVNKMVELGGMTYQTFMVDQKLQELLIDLKEEKELSAKEYLDFSKEQLSMLEGMVNSNPYIYQVRIYAENNSFPEMVPVLYRKERMEKAPWAESYVSGKWQMDYPDFLMAGQTDKRLVSLVNDINDIYGNKIGVIEVAVTMNDMFPFIYDQDESSWGGIILDNGYICTADEEKASRWSGFTEEICKKAGNLDEKRIIHTRINGEEVLLSVFPMREFDGSCILLTSVEKQAKEILYQEILMGVALVFLLLGLAVMINSIVKSLLNKFYEILSVVRTIQGGDIDRRIPDIGTDEMGEMGSQINRMLDRIQELSRENVDREVLIKNTEIKALQNQINAHFIYNVLESIKMMAEIDEKYEISDAVTALGELLRYNMKWVSGSVTVREEIAYIKNYVQLMNLRYDFVTTLSVNISENILSQKIPKMSLQPIVENAICHGIVASDKDAIIYIKALVKKECFEIEITDSGIGMTKNQMELLEKKLKGEVEAGGGSGNGIGLKNVQDRIQMQFGKEYGLKFYSREGCFTKVSVRLPLEDIQKGE